MRHLCISTRHIDILDILTNKSETTETRDRTNKEQPIKNQFAKLTEDQPDEIIKNTEVNKIDFHQ